MLNWSYSLCIVLLILLSCDFKNISVKIVKSIKIIKSQFFIHALSKLPLRGKVNEKNPMFTLDKWLAGRRLLYILLYVLTFIQPVLLIPLLTSLSEKDGFHFRKDMGQKYIFVHVYNLQASGVCSIAYSVFRSIFMQCQW